MDNGRIMKELKELQEGVKNVSANLVYAESATAIVKRSTLSNTIN